MEILYTFDRVRDFLGCLSNADGAIQSVSLGVFLSTLEVTVVSTALVTITNALEGFERNSWIVTSYLLTYSGGCIRFS